MSSATKLSRERDLLRFLTAGSVDDGKSTLIGRLLYESHGIYEDQLSSVQKASAAKNVALDLSLLTDGLRAEREQGITIDVAYRYFSTPHRKFIIADTPGHEQYTRNMATGSSTSELALILVDARKGVLKQTRRHALISWLMGIRRMIIAVNKMDLVDFDAQAFHSVREEFGKFGASLTNTQFYFVPLSALSGENVIHSNGRMPWYDGPSLLQLLETLPAKPEVQRQLRFPVQMVIRPNQDFRGYAGQVGSGTVRPGQEVLALPSKQRTTIKEVLLYDQSLEEASPPQSVVLTTTDHIDLSRGDMLVSADAAPTVSSKITAYLIWLSHTPLHHDTRYLIKHTTRVLCGRIRRLNYKIDVNTLERTEADLLQLNEIGEVQIDLQTPIFCDPYESNRSTGSFIVIDPHTNDTVAAGMVLTATPIQAGDSVEDITSRIARQRGVTVWFTGLSGAGKTTICRAVATELLAYGLQVEVMDGDIIRTHLCKDLGFSKQDRDENIRRIAFVAQLLTRNGTITLVSAISPYRAARDLARQMIGDFLEVYVSTPLAVCEVRDPKDLYQKARAGKIRAFTGIDDPYEPPLNPEIVCDTARESTRESSLKVVSAVLRYLSAKKS
ncbi:MAG TPA: sulfate adenylyltransferase subunit CysN [Terriglobales bacterium]|nr:sulfate adenylyltransferase subunit CysN [Terriglobales bacterium]